MHKILLKNFKYFGNGGARTCKVMKSVRTEIEIIDSITLAAQDQLSLAM